MTNKLTATKDQYAVGSTDWIREQAQRQLAGLGPETNLWVRDVFPDILIVENFATSALLQYPYSVTDQALTLGAPQEVSIEYVAKRRAAVKSPILTGPVFKAAEEQRIVYAPVLVPDEPDSDGDVVTAEQIERVAHGWLEKYQNLDFMHTLNNVARPVESYIARKDEEFEGGIVPAGSWVMGTRVPDELWESVKSGELGGLSIMAVPADQMAAAVKAERADDLISSAKRTTLADLGDDWIVPFVSIVDHPAVPKAKWVALKSEQPTEPDTAFMDRLKSWFLLDEPAQKAGRRFSDATYRQIIAARDALMVLADEAEKERKERSGKQSAEQEDEMTAEEIQNAVKSALTDALGDFEERLTALESAQSTEPEEEEQPETETETPESEDVEALKSEIAELKKFKADVEKRFGAKPKSLDDTDADEAAEKSANVYVDKSGQKYERDYLGRARPVA